MANIQLEDIHKKIDDSVLFNNIVEVEDRKSAAKLMVELAWNAGMRQGMQDSVDSLGGLVQKLKV